MTVKAKRFRIGVEGATTDGREIQREWLEQMAASYNLQLTERVLVSADGAISTVNAEQEPEEPEEMWTVRRG